VVARVDAAGGGVRWRSAPRSDLGGAALLRGPEGGVDAAADGWRARNGDAVASIEADGTRVSLHDAASGAVRWETALPPAALAAAAAGPSPGPPVCPGDDLPPRRALVAPGPPGLVAVVGPCGDAVVLLAASDGAVASSSSVASAAASAAGGARVVAVGPAGGLVAFEGGAEALRWCPRGDAEALCPAAVAAAAARAAAAAAPRGPGGLAPAPVPAPAAPAAAWPGGFVAPAADGGAAAWFFPPVDSRDEAAPPPAPARLPGGAGESVEVSSLAPPFAEAAF